MSGLYITPTEALLQVAKQHPFKAAVKCGEDQWPCTDLWARVGQIADKIHDLDDTRNPIGLHMGREIDYVAAAHVIWLSGRVVVFLSSKWAPEVLQEVLERANVHLILFGALKPPAMSGVCSVSTFSLVEFQRPSSYVAPTSPLEVVEVVSLICSITPISGSTGVPKSIVYPMRKSSEVLSEESSTFFQPTDGQWLRSGTTFLRSLCEIRCFTFNQTTLYLGPLTSVADQCTALCEELESIRCSQLLQVHFTSSVCRAFADFAQMRSGGSQLPNGFNRVCWMVIGGESLSIRDLELARDIFPNATTTYNFACSEVGFASISQMFVRPTDPMPSIILFRAVQRCMDLVLLDQSLSVIPKTEDGATGIVAFITHHSATHYLANEEASRHIFCPRSGKDTLLYTDEIGCTQDDGTIVIRGRSPRNVKVNGLFVDLGYVEHILAPAFAHKFKALCVSSFKLVKSCSTEKIVLFASTETGDAMFIFKHARAFLHVSFNGDPATVISSVRRIPEMPLNASYKIAILQKMADPAEALAPGLSAKFPTINPPPFRVDALAEKIVAKIPMLSESSDIIPTNMPLFYSGLNSISVVRLYMWLQSERDYRTEMSHSFEDKAMAQVLTTKILSEEITDELDADLLAEEIAAEITKLSESLEAVPKDIPLLYLGLNSITMVRLHIWLQSEHKYEGEMLHLFDEKVTAQVLAREILRHDSGEEAQVEDSNIESDKDTVVEGGASEIHVLEKDSDITTEDSFGEAVPELHVQVSNKPVHDLANEDDIPDIYVVGPSEDEACDSADEDVACQILIVNESDLDHGSEVVVSYCPPKGPLPGLKSPLCAAFPFNDKIPESPSSEHSPFSFLFSSWVTPLRSPEARRPLLDSVLMLAM